MQVDTLGKPVATALPINLVSMSNDVSGTSGAASARDSVWLSSSPAFFGAPATDVLLPTFEAIHNSRTGDLQVADVANDLGGDGSDLALQLLDVVFASNFPFIL
jgi:hypothetical protein